MIRELKLEKMDKSEMRKVEGGDGGGIPDPGKDCDGCNNCGTSGNDEFMNAFTSS